MRDATHSRHAVLRRRMQWVGLSISFKVIALKLVLLVAGVFCSPSADDETADLETTLGILEDGRVT